MTQRMIIRLACLVFASSSLYAEAIQLTPELCEQGNHMCHNACEASNTIPNKDNCKGLCEDGKVDCLKDAASGLSLPEAGIP